MTGNDIFTLAVSFLPERPADSTAKEYAAGWLNVLLAESLPTENTIRRFNGQPALTKAPIINSLDETVDYSDELVRIALPFGLASFCFKDDDDDYWSQDYRARYISALNEAQKCVITDIQDSYGGEGYA